MDLTDNTSRINREMGKTAPLSIAQSNSTRVTISFDFDRDNDVDGHDLVLRILFEISSIKYTNFQTSVP